MASLVPSALSSSSQTTLNAISANPTNTTTSTSSNPLATQEDVVMQTTRDPREFINTLMDRVVTWRNKTQKFSLFEPTDRYAYVRSRQMILVSLQAQNNANLRVLDVEEETMAANGGLDDNEANRLATARGELNLSIMTAMDQTDILWDHPTMSAMLHVLKDEAATELQIRANEILDKGFPIKFVECPLTELSRKDRTDILNKLQARHGQVDVNSLKFSKDSKELWITFYTPEAKNKCVKAGRCEWGVPTSNINPVFIDNLYAMWTAFVEPLMEGTTEQQVAQAFTELGAAPSGVKIFKDAAFVHYGTEDDLFNALRIQRIKINNRKINIVAAKQSDPDELKGILGFWDGKTTHLEPLYTALNPHVWDFLYLQPVFWDNGALKHYYFIKFPSVRAKEQAMLEPAKVEGNILQIFPIVRDEAGRLVFPPEGAWKRRRTAAPNPIHQNVQLQANARIAAQCPQNNQFVRITVPTFD